MVDENDIEARAAAENYVKSMVEFLNMALMEASFPILNNPHDDQLVFRVSKIETACRFNKDHVGNGAYCECLERDDATKEFNTNRMTELHNTAAAMRRIVSHAYWFPWRGARIASIGRIFLKFWHFDTNVMRASFSQDLRRLFDKLVIHTYEAIVQRGSGRFRSGAYAGGMLTSPGHYKHTEYIILRNTSMRLKDEFYRQGLLESVVAPLTKAELQELDLADTDCFVCMEPLGTGQDPHAAVRFKCAAEKHVVGKNCWMKSLRRMRSKYNSRELKCPLCSDCVLSDWKTPFNNNHLWAWDVVRSTLPQLAQEMGDAGYAEL
ncbi:hypothetical protein BDP81DRAFT_378143 [Colletotrichum phormii]|uniref:Uncharacterized protein n=1 Tax=Colletotrichum phormii TaxID=359342 RepID=A0AAI9ZND4_9PEZI|nr:uncharacterized protein BDP81DRAFT_378143 [Colletotrichum phormii]KAK1634860.1 hypothetical protein BDP81DRAFT_378143 [Colletotrichum phormii]